MEIASPLSGLAMTPTHLGGNLKIPLDPFDNPLSANPPQESKHLIDTNPPLMLQLVFAVPRYYSDSPSTASSSNPPDSKCAEEESVEYFLHTQLKTALYPQAGTDT